MDVRELAWAAAAAPLVLRVREFLRWVGDRRRLSRERAASGARDRGYAYLSLGSWAEGECAVDGHADHEFRDRMGLLEFTLAARMLEVVVERRERTVGGGVREHGWVLPGPGYPPLPEGASLVWRSGVELLPVLWRQRRPGVDPRLAETAPRRLLERLAALGSDGLSVRVLAGESAQAGLSGTDLDAVVRLFESLGLARFDYTIDQGERCALTALGRHALTLLPAPGDRSASRGLS